MPVDTQGLNVSSYLISLDHTLDVHAICVVGRTEQLLFEQECAQRRIPLHLVLHDNLTRINTTVITQNGSGHSDIHYKERGHEYTADLSTRVLDDVYRHICNIIGDDSGSSYIILSGSIPHGMNPRDVVNMLHKVMTTHCGRIKLIVDTSGRMLSNVLELDCYLIKPNMDEALTIVGKQSDDGQFIQCIRRTCHCDTLVTHGGHDALFIPKIGDAISVPVPHVNVVNTVSAGDATLAGYIYYDMLHRDIHDKLTFAMCCGSVCCTMHDKGTLDISMVMQLAKSNIV